MLCGEDEPTVRYPSAVPDVFRPGTDRLPVRLRRVQHVDDHHQWKLVGERLQVDDSRGERLEQCFRELLDRGALLRDPSGREGAVSDPAQPVRVAHRRSAACAPVEGGERLERPAFLSGHPGDHLAGAVSDERRAAEPHRVEQHGLHVLVA